jgi:hypothetical protein
MKRFAIATVFFFAIAARPAHAQFAPGAGCNRTYIFDVRGGIPFYVGEDTAHPPTPKQVKRCEDRAMDWVRRIIREDACHDRMGHHANWFQKKYYEWKYGWNCD